MSRAAQTHATPIRAADERRFEVLRLSITPQCNLRCTYCRPRGREDQGPAAAASVDRVLDRVRRLMQVMPMAEIHITGGEATLHPGLGDIVRGCRDLGIPSVALTTNGTSSSALLSDLASAGLSRVNVSLDAVTPTVFALMAGSAGESGASPVLDRIKANIEWARELGLPVKINTTVVRGMNDREIPALLEWAMERRISVRFLELMRMGPVRDAHAHLFVSMSEMLQVIGSRHSFVPVVRERAATACLFEMENGYRFGVIANHSQPFCGDCNRLRLDAEGRLFGCISSERGILMPADGGEESGAGASALSVSLEEAFSEKRGRFEGCSTSMRRIGG